MGIFFVFISSFIRLKNVQNAVIKGLGYSGNSRPESGKRANIPDPDPPLAAF